ncbi:hypothetical protein WDU94_003639, partial [Cyamophila willieti]
MFIEGELRSGDGVAYHRPFQGEDVLIFFQQLFTNKFNIQFHFPYEEFPSLILGAMHVISKHQRHKTNNAIHYFVKMMTDLKDYASPHQLHYILHQVYTMFDRDERLIELEGKILERIRETDHEDEAKTVKYQKLCQGQLERSPKDLSLLKCYYKRHSGSQFLLIGPVKVEQLNLDPEILLFHDILTENQIEAIKISAAPHMTRSTVLSATNDEMADPKVSNIRLTHHSSLTRTDTKLEDQVRLLTQDVTGLDTAGYETLAINIYGIGGYYTYHMDSSANEARKRSATMLYYLSDVQLGGATIFPYFNLTVEPRKGTAIFWYNMHASGSMDYRMTHSACPVLVG